MKSEFALHTVGAEGVQVHRSLMSTYCWKTLPDSHTHLRRYRGVSDMNAPCKRFDLRVKERNYATISLLVREGECT